MIIRAVHAALALLFCAGIAYAQVGLPWPGPGTAHSSGGSPAGPFALVAHAGSASVSTISTPVNCTGATMAVVIINTFTSPAVNPQPSDTSGSTYVQIGTQVGDSSHNSVAIWWTNVTGTTSFHWTANAIAFGAIEGACFSDGSAPSTVDQNSETGNSATPGSVTPGVNNELLVTGYSPPQSSSGTPTVGSSFIVTDAFAFNTSGGIGGAMAYKIQTTAGAENPAWAGTTGGSTNGSAVIATFK